MDTSSALPQKQHLPNEVWKVATTLSYDVQNAAMRKARELGFDLSKGKSHERFLSRATIGSEGPLLLSDEIAIPRSVATRDLSSNPTKDFYPERRTGARDRDLSGHPTKDFEENTEGGKITLTREGISLWRPNCGSSIERHLRNESDGRHESRRSVQGSNDMGMNVVDIQNILRHANIATTQAYYTFPNPEKARAGLKKLAETVRKKYGIKA
jgi:hypothetical protein